MGKANHPLRNSAGHWNREAVMDIICPRIAEGMTREEALAAGVDIDGEHRGLPTVTLLGQWAMGDELIAERLARARKAKAHKLAEETLQIAEEAPRITPKGQVDAGAEKHRDTRIKTRQWLAEKWNRDDYGNQVAVDVHHHGAINLQQVLEEAHSRVIEGEVIPADSVQPAALPPDCSDLFD